MSDWTGLGTPTALDEQRSSTREDEGPPVSRDRRPTLREYGTLGDQQRAVDPQLQPSAEERWSQLAPEHRVRGENVDEHRKPSAAMQALAPVRFAAGVVAGGRFVESSQFGALRSLAQRVARTRTTTTMRSGTTKIRVEDYESLGQLNMIAAAVEASKRCVDLAALQVAQHRACDPDLSDRMAKFFAVTESLAPAVYWACVASLRFPFCKVQHALNTSIPVEIEPEWVGDGGTVAYIVTPRAWSDVHLHQKWFKLPPRLQAEFLLHECFHKYAGVDDVQYFTSLEGRHGEAWRELSFWDHVNNADSYVQFATHGRL